ncbi:unnamed protein product, partial [Brachionus calyciflorus]
KKVGSKRGKIKQIHKSRLKIYYYSKPELNIKPENSDEENEVQIGFNNKQKILNKKTNLGSNNLKQNEIKFDEKIHSSESSKLSDEESNDPDYKPYRHQTKKIKNKIIKNNKPNKHQVVITSSKQKSDSENETLASIKNKIKKSIKNLSIKNLLFFLLLILFKQLQTV